MNMNNNTQSKKPEVPPPFVWSRGYLIQLNNYEFWSESEPTDPNNANLFMNIEEAKATMHEIRSDEDAIFDSRNGFPRIVKVEQKIEFVEVVK